RPVWPFLSQVPSFSCTPLQVAFSCACCSVLEISSPVVFLSRNVAQGTSLARIRKQHGAVCGVDAGACRVGGRRWAVVGGGRLHDRKPRLLPRCTEPSGACFGGSFIG